MRRIKALQKKKMNNRGMTLVEVLVAMTILTVVSLVLLQAFVSSFNYNKQAKEKQRSINLAQSIMESYKAYKLEDVCRQFNNVDPFSIYKGSVGGYGQTGVQSVTPSGEFTPTADNCYAFSMSDIQYDGQVYDVTVSMKPNEELVSKEQISDTPVFNAFNDAIFAQPLNEYDYIYIDAIKKLEEAGMKEEDVDKIKDSAGSKYNELKKENIIIDERRVDVSIYTADGAEKVSVTTTFKYSFDKYQYEDEEGVVQELTSSGNTVVVNSSTTGNPAYDVYDNSATRANGAKLENVYVYYYPAYSEESRLGLIGLVCKNDVINIVNNSDNVKKVFLIKQINPDLGEDISLAAPLYDCEQSYKVYVNLDGKKIDFYSNFRKKLSGGTASSTVSISAGSKVHDEFYDIKDKILVYNIEISVTNKKTGENTIVLDGTVNDR